MTTYLIRAGYGIVAAGENDPNCCISAGEGHEIAEGIAHRSLEQPLDALDKDDFATLRSKDVQRAAALPAPARV